MHHDNISNNWNNVVGDFRDEYVITMVSNLYIQKKCWKS